MIDRFRIGSHLGTVVWLGPWRPIYYPPVCDPLGPIQEDERPF